MSAGQNPNLPRPGAITLDHSGHFVADAASTAQALHSFGFTVTPFSAQVQPDPETGEMALTGTGNVCVMLAEGYLEFLVQTADTPLGREFRTALDRRAGLHLAAFGAADAADCHAALTASGHAMRPLVRMSRSIETVNGTEEARFTVARLENGAMPEGRVQIVTHGTERALWQPRWIEHRNGAVALASLIVSAPDPDDAAARFARFLNRGSERRADGTIVIPLDRGRLEFMPETEASALIGTPVEPNRSAFAACRLVVDDLGRAREVIEAGGGACRTANGSLVVPFPPALGSGAWILDARSGAGPGSI